MAYLKISHFWLSLNIEKTEYILLGTRNRQNMINEIYIDIKIDGIQLKRVRNCKHLGIIDENFTWQDHILKVQKKTSSGLHMLKTVKRYVIDTSTMQMVYNANSLIPFKLL